ncbi:cyclin-domain-containing protein [Gautieria morchelliformis]|nr:cyclin-domain-containing protein [Gautieria morchelliformis]
MLALATPLSHSQSADCPSSTPATIRSRSASRSCPHASSSTPSVPLSASHSNSQQGVNRSSSKRSNKSSLPHSRSSADDHRNEATTSRSTDQQSHPSQQPPHPEQLLCSDAPPLRLGAAPAPLEKIHEQDPNQLLQLLASLLQQIASANDQIRPSPSVAETPILHADDSNSSFVHRPPIWSTLTSASRQAFSTPTSSLTFHARNIPTITLEAYLLRILKYCPTTNEVFLSLLVYFDRMSKLTFDATGKGFAIDSFNVHRLVIAGVTVASKFFSDVFYTNSRYAKVGGLPQSELNQLELQFLLLNDFRLSIATEEMQRYAEQLQIYARKSETGLESVSGRKQPPSQSQSPRDLIASSMRRMGAADAYGGRLPGEPMTEAETIRETYSGVVGYHKAMVLENKATEDVEEEVTQHHSRESSIESGAETEEEGGETDDEPTIRAHSSAGSETQSLCTNESEDTYSEREPDEDERDGRTPERGVTMSP